MTNKSGSFRKAKWRRNQARKQNLPDPMPGRDADGNPLWLHYDPIRWERYP